MPSDDTTTPSGSRRAQRARRRRLWQRSLILGAVVALLVAGAAFAVTGPLRDDDTGAESQRAVTNGAPASAPVAASDAEHSCRSPLDPADPLRLWIGGDSLAGSLGPSLGELTGKSGVVQPVFDARGSSGLLSPEFVNWPKRGREDMETYNPEVTVFMVGANDAKTLQDGAERDPDWRTGYAALVEEMIAVLTGNGRVVYWVGAPVMADSAYSERVRAVNEVVRDAAARYPEMIYVDAYSLFSTPDGTYAPSLSVAGGKVVRVRGADGIHFTPEGGDLLATTLFERLDPACKITKQAVPGEAKQTIEAKGSSSVPGTRQQRR
jgi:uncharacterized protein